MGVVITFFTIVLDGEPWIEKHLPVFQSLKISWRWIVIEGVSDNVECTRWCSRMVPRLSKDGTSQYLDSISDQRVTILRKSIWPGKVAMCNAALADIHVACLLWQVDSDEIWTQNKIESVVRLLSSHPERNCAWFWCRFFVGPGIAVLWPDSWANNSSFEWKRVWRFEPGMRFKTHEPPVIDGFEERPLLHSDTESIGAVFDHHSYSTLAQVEFKQRYYAGKSNPNARLFRNLVDGWKRLQSNEKWPVHLRDFFSFVPPETIADKIDVVSS